MPTLFEAAEWPHISRCLDEALELDAVQRGPWLERLRASEPSIADAVATLLAEQSASQQECFLEGVVPHPAGAATLTGRRLGAYTLQALIGQGGMGSVWRALRSDGKYDAAVAVKLLNTALIGAAGVARFRREGSILARLQHPHIAHLLDAGVGDDGQPYLVLELVDGEAIDVYCDRHRLGAEQRIRLFLDVLAAVEHAHAHLVVHRDLKPSNVLVMADGQVKLLDFGIAKLLEVGTDDSDDAPTRDDTRALTPQYAAPEQLLGGPITTATDVYALGVMLYRLLCGRHPTGANTASAVEFIRATLDTEPVRLSDRSAPRSPSATADIERIAAARGTSPAALQRRLRGDLDNIVARTLRKAAEERYASVAALGDDLRRHLAHEPVSARPDSLAYRSAKFVRRHRGGVAAMLLIGLAVAGGLIGTVTQARRAQAETARAQHERDNALRELVNAAASNEFISDLLGEGFAKPFTTTELLARGEALVAQQFATDPAQRARLEFMMAKLYGQSMQARKATELMVKAQTTARSVADPSLQADIECELGGERGMAGAFDAGFVLLDAAIARLRSAAELDRSVLAGCLHERSQVNKFHGDPKAALADAQAALDALGPPRPDQRGEEIGIRIALASAQSNLGQTAQPVQEYRRAIAELVAMGRGRSAMAATMYNNLGLLLSRAGQSLDALDAYEKALDVARGGPAGPSATLEGNYGRLLIILGRADEAKPLFERALAVAEAQGNREATPMVLLQGSTAWCATGELAHCAEMLSTARRLFTAMLPPGHIRMAALEAGEARLALARGDLQLALTKLRREKAMADAARERNPNGLGTLALLAQTEQQLGELDAAAEHAASAVAQSRAAMAGFDHSEWLGRALLAQGLVQNARGDGSAARATWRAALVELQATTGESAPFTAEVRRLLAGP